jgi:tRNA threonylcarbamoyladenosine biosynthesis protein TsaB
MYILHIETATAICSVALSNGPELVAYRDLVEEMNHTATLTPAIDELLKAVSIQPGNIGAISISSGPGSYTGLRVGSSTAKAMAFSLEIPIIAVPTLTALASAAFLAIQDVDLVLPMIDARRKEVYTGLYDRAGQEIWPVSSVILDEKFFSEVLAGKGQVVCCGDGSLKIGEMAPLDKNLQVEKEILCSARHLVAPAWDLFQQGNIREALHFVPYYMKPPNITVPRQTGFV